MSSRVGVALVLAVGVIAPTGGLRRAESAPQSVRTPAVYAPFEFLIGEWNVAVAGGAPAAVSRFQWSPARTYIRYSGALLVNGREQPSWEGLMVWNGVRRTLDFLLVLDPTSDHLVQEQGTMRVEPDGTVVREVTAYYSEGAQAPPEWSPAGPDGATGLFRHTFKADGPDRIVSGVLRRTDSGWEPNFPGSDHLIMTRR